MTSNKILEKKVLGFVDIAKTAKKDNNKKDAIDAMLNAWESIPEPKINLNESYMVAKYLIQLYLSFDMPEAAEKWIDKIYDLSKDRFDSGELEFLNGRIAFTKGDVNKATNLFKVAYKKSEGRSFTRDDSKFKSLLKF